MSASPAHIGPAQDLIPLSEQLDNHDEYAPEATDDLAGRQYALHFLEGVTLQVRFDDADRLSWSSTAPIVGRNEGQESYEAVLLRPDIYLVVVARLTDRASALAIVDLASRRAVVNLTQLIADDQRELKEETHFLQAGIGQPLAEAFARTAELVGKRVHHRYSSSHAFEHIYLNDRTYAYQGLEGPEAGVADVDLTDTFKIADELYLFSWHERAQAFNGAIALDLAEGRAFGRLFGWDRHAGTAQQIRTGSIATVLNVTTYEGL